MVAGSSTCIIHTIVRDDNTLQMPCIVSQQLNAAVTHLLDATVHDHIDHGCPSMSKLHAVGALPVGCQTRPYQQELGCYLILACVYVTVWHGYMDTSFMY